MTKRVPGSVRIDAMQVQLLIIDPMERPVLNKRCTRSGKTLEAIRAKRNPIISGYLVFILRLIFEYSVDPRFLPSAMIRAVDDCVWKHRDRLDDMPAIFDGINLPKLYHEARTSKVLSTRQAMAFLLEKKVQEYAEPQMEMAI